MSLTLTATPAIHELPLPSVTVMAAAASATAASYPFPGHSHSTASLPSLGSTGSSHVVHHSQHARSPSHPQQQSAHTAADSMHTNNDSGYAVDQLYPHASTSSLVPSIKTESLSGFIRQGDLVYDNGPPLSAPLPSIGTRSYTVLKEVGDGSFGTVWLADWHSPLA